MKNEEYKKLSIDEFTKAAERYESNHAGIYEMCKKDYPEILEELEKEKKMQETVVEIRNKYGKNAILKGINYLDKATMRKRNTLIGGHNA